MIQIGERHSLRDANGIESPPGSDFLEGEILSIAKREIGRLQFRKEQERRLGGARFLRCHLLSSVRVEHIVVVAIGDEQVLISV